MGLLGLRGLGLYLVRSYSVPGSILNSLRSSPVLSSVFGPYLVRSGPGSVLGSVDIFEFLLRKKGWYGLDTMLVTWSIEA